VIRA